MLTALSILLALILTLLLWVLLGELTFTFDTKNHIYSIVLFGLIRSSVESQHEKFFLRFEAPFYLRDFDLESAMFNLIEDNLATKKVNKKKSNKSKLGFFKKRMRKRFIRVLKSFKIDKWYVNIDTNDCALNGKLYPLTWAISSIGYPVHINFIGKQDITLIVKNRLAKIIKAALL